MSCLRRFAVTAAATALALLSVTGSAEAQRLTVTGEHLIRIGAAGGVVVPTSDTRAALKQGIHAQGFVLVNLRPGMPLRFNLGYQKFDLKRAFGAAVSQATGAPADSGSTEILSGVAGTQLDLLHGPVRPYVVLGLGGFDVRGMMTAAAGANAVSQLKFGIDGGVGLALRLGRLDAFVEGHLQNVYTQRGLIDARSIQAVPVSFGVLF